MEERDKLTLSKALPELVATMKVNARVKAAIIAADMFDEKTLDHIFGAKSNGELVFRFVQKLKRKEGKFDDFISALKIVGQDNIAELLDTMRSAFSADEVRDYSLTPPRKSPKDVDVRLPQSESHEMYTPSSGQSNTPRDWKANGHDDQRLSLREKRDKLKACMPKLPYSQQTGDAVIVATYYRECCNFADGSSDEIPGPYANPPTERVTINESLIAYIPPLTAATIGKFFGGKVLYTTKRKHGGNGWATFDGTVERLVVRFYINGNHIVDSFALLSGKLEEAVAASLGWYPARIATPWKERRGDLYDLNKKQTVGEWYKDTLTNHLHVFPPKAK